MSQQNFTDRHGIEVAYWKWAPPEPRGIVLIAHGASEHGGRYERFGRALNTAGFAAYAIDQRGHGRTAAATGRGRVGPPGGVALLDDLEDLRSVATQDLPDAPVVLFAHSMGSAIALAYLTKHSRDLAGAVLSGLPVPITGVAELAQGFRAAADAGLRDEAVDALSGFNKPFEPARTPFDWLSRDDAEVDAYIADPLCGENNPLTYGYFVDLFEVLAPALEPPALGAIRCPVLLVAGGDDPAAENGANPRALHEGLRRAGVQSAVTVYPGARHELLNEHNRDEVTAAVMAWIEETLLPHRA